MPRKFTENVIRIIRHIPRGRVMTYGSIALFAGNPRGARQVSWILHSSSRKYHLPWHRVVNSKGKISLKNPMEYEHQKRLLMAEGVEFSQNNVIDLDVYFAGGMPAKGGSDKGVTRNSC